MKPEFHNVEYWLGYSDRTIIWTAIAILWLLWIFPDLMDWIDEFNINKPSGYWQTVIVRYRNIFLVIAIAIVFITAIVAATKIKW